MNPIFKSVLEKNGEWPYIVRRLSIEDLQLILSVQDRVAASMEKEGILQPLSPKEYQYILEGNGMMIGAFVEEELIAFRALLIPSLNDPEHLGLDIGLQAAELSSVIYQEISNVLPEYRGNRLQKTLAKLIMEELGKEAHHFHFVCCTVAPFNIPSLKDKFSQGMQIAALKQKYGGQLRYTFVKDLKEPVPQICKETILIDMGDTVRQQELLAEGFRGIRMLRQSNDDVVVEYGRLF
ncbi:GNAT family N-acetyltransferase [Neobacillus mesonae]|uniref:GNAT family N-acetyltransferase n=1 Tax=Neobacillus mesonae TaxID=1193713 RepID=UPI00203F917D|nr:GNAT family N-acetyltransferase [Neobacillus mesonae]MCM3571023.1 GNAT family N-acetyltransferase [Neobacillus mesonae]